MPFGILSAKISVFVGSGFAFAVSLYLSLPGITGNLENFSDSRGYYLQQLEVFWMVVFDEISRLDLIFCCY